MTVDHTTRRDTLRLGLAAGLAAPLVTLAGAGGASAEPVDATGATDTVDPDSAGGRKPTIVLVHGAWADAGSFAAVTARLQRAGYPVLSAPNQLRSLHGDAAYVAAFVNERTKGPVVLVGHSYGGAVITNAARSTPTVTKLVYVNAFAPAAGENVLALTTVRDGSALKVKDITTVIDLVPYPDSPKGDLDTYIRQSVFVTSFANDLPRRTAAELGASQRPLALSAGLAASGRPAWKSIPSWYLVGTRDQIIPPAEQRFMAHRAGSVVAEAPAGHLSMLSHPGAVTALIVRAARHH